MTPLDSNRPRAPRLDPRRNTDEKNSLGWAINAAADWRSRAEGVYHAEAETPDCWVKAAAAAAIAQAWEATATRLQHVQWRCEDTLTVEDPTDLPAPSTPGELPCMEVTNGFGQVVARVFRADDGHTLQLPAHLAPEQARKVLDAYNQAIREAA